MINYLQIENFKSLRRVSLPLRRLNMLFGMNGMGKSSVMQVLLLLRQSYWENKKADLNKLHINGDLVRLGSVRDVYCQTAEEEYIRFFLKYSDGTEHDLVYDGLSQQPNNMAAMSRNVDVSDTKEPLFNMKCFYLGAEHIGPRIDYKIDSWNPSSADVYGTTGKYIVPFLAMNGESIRVPECLCHEEGKTDSLIDQVSAWMSYISPGVKLSAVMAMGQESARLKLRYAGEALDSADISPVNVGFGIPYVLPLITELLISDENTLLMLENPESHLHPRGQTAIAKLIAKVAASGAQVICESHSDHIINGIRIAVKKEELIPEYLSTFYFEKNTSQETEACAIDIDKNGNFSDYPAGLLDEWGISMAELL